MNFQNEEKKSTMACEENLIEDDDLLLETGN